MIALMKFRKLTRFGELDSMEGKAEFAPRFYVEAYPTL